MSDKLIIGRLENIDLPDLSIKNLTARVDTGAQSSSLHVDNIMRLEIDGKPAVAFDIHPEIHNVKHVVRCKTFIYDIRKVKSSNGVSEQRYVIKVPALLGERLWDIEISLTDRSDMTYLMLLGREALNSHFLIDPSKTFLAGKNKSK